MPERMTVEQYLAGEETNRPQELAYGIVREPPAPGFHHQIIVGRLYTRLDRHVRRHNAGLLVISPIDVILDAQRALVVQPDVALISARQDIRRDRIWGPPDLVIEVLSTSNRRHDSTRKVRWYQEYGVRECWLVDPASNRIEVLDLTTSDASRTTFEGRETLRSAVLPRLRMRPADVFDG